MVTAVIIGGGPAGCQCALWLKMLGYEVIIVEEKNFLGGLQRKSPYINNWMIGTFNLSGQEIAKNIQNHIEKMEIPVIYSSTIESIKQNKEGFDLKINHKIISALTLVIATGVSPSSGPFKSAKNVMIGPGKQIDEFNFANEKVAIFGGGDNAAENYSFIKKKKTSQCHIYARTIRARHSLWSKVDQSDVFVGEYKADQENMSVTYKGEKRIYDHFIVLYGWEANIPSAFSEFKDSLLDSHNFIISDGARKTKIPNIFAAGEVTHQSHPCVTTAMADGVIVAKAIQKELEKKKSSNKLRCRL